MLFSHTGKGGMTCAIEQHPGRGHGTRPRHIEDGTPAECCVAGPGSCSPQRGRLVRKDIVMRLALRKRFACPACQPLDRRDGPTAVGKAVEIIWAFLNRLSKMPVDRGKTRRFSGEAVAIGAQPRGARERLPGVQFGCYEVCRSGGLPCCAWGSANADAERCIFGLLRVGLFKINRLMID